MKIAYMLRDPLDLALLFIYVIGVLVLIFAAMQLLHAVLYKDPKARHDGVVALLLGIVLLAPRIVYHQFRLDAADYTKSVTVAYQNYLDIALEESDGYSLLAIQQSNTDPDDADILVISTPLYTADGERNATGLAVLKAVSEKMLKKKSAVELRYIVFAGEGHALEGARSYISRLSDDEKARVVGNLQLGSMDTAALGDYQIGVSSGRENALTDRLVKSVKRMSGQKATMHEDKSSDHTAFSMEGIVSAQLQQGSAAPATDADMDELAKAAAIVGDTVQTIMCEKDHSFRTEAEETSINIRAAGAFQPYVDRFSFDEGIPAMEQKLGTKLYDTGTSDTDGCKIYTAALYILQQDTPVTVEVHVMDHGTGALHELSIDSAALGVDEAVLRQMLTNFFGEEAENTSADGSTEHVYLDSQANAMYDVSTVMPQKTTAKTERDDYVLTIKSA